MSEVSKNNSGVSKINPAEFGLDEQKVTTIEAAFMPKIVEREALKEIYERLITSELTPQLCKEAGEVRKKLVKVRTGIADIHKTQKAFYLAAGRFVDAWKNKETEPIEQMETSLSEIETHFERIEAERMKVLKAERIATLAQVCENPEMYNSELLTEKAFEDLFTGLKLAKESREKAEQEAETERLRIEKELEAERERKAAADKQKNDRLNKLFTLGLKWDGEQFTHKDINVYFADLLGIDDVKFNELFGKISNHKLELDKEEEAEKERLRKENEKNQQLLKQQQLENEAAETERKRLQKIIDDKKIEDEKEAKANREAEIKAAKAPKKQKLNTWIDSLNCTAPVGLESDETTALILEKFEGFKKWAKSQIEVL